MYEDILAHDKAESHDVRHVSSQAWTEGGVGIMQLDLRRWLSGSKTLLLRTYHKSTYTSEGRNKAHKALASCPSNLTFPVFGRLPVSMPWQTTHLLLASPRKGTRCRGQRHRRPVLPAAFIVLFPKASQPLKLFLNIPPVSRPVESVVEIASVQTG